MPRGTCTFKQRDLFPKNFFLDFLGATIAAWGKNATSLRWSYQPDVAGRSPGKSALTIRPAAVQKECQVHGKPLPVSRRLGGR
jgi:hypothetical protein